MLSGNFYGKEIRHGNFGGLNFCPGIFWVLIFAPIRSSLSLKIRITPRPHPPPCFLLSIRRDLTSGSYTQLLGRGDRNRLIEMIALIQIRFSVIKENDFWDFGK